MPDALGILLQRMGPLLLPCEFLRLLIVRRAQPLKLRPIRRRIGNDALQFAAHVRTRSITARQTDGHLYRGGGFVREGVGTEPVRPARLEAIVIRDIRPSEADSK